MAAMIQVPAQVMGMNPRQDRSWRLVFETRELSGDEVAVLADNFQGEGWLVFKPNDVKVDEVPESDADSGAKSPSQRLRSVLFILWKQQGERGSFEAFYQTKMQLLIEYIKNQLEAT